MTKLNKSLIVKAFSYIYKSILARQSYTNICKGLKGFLSGTPFKAAKDITLRHMPYAKEPDKLAFFLGMNKNVVEMVKAFNKDEKKTERKEKTARVKEMLGENRGSGIPRIFYICSVHDGCAEDHKDYQGRIYVDRFWKSVLRQHGEEFLIEPVEAYIRNHDVMSLQAAMKGPPYLITRPHCRHFVTALDTLYTLTSSTAAIIKEHPELRKKSGKRKSQDKLNEEYYRLRYQIHTKMLDINRATPLLEYIRTDIKQFKKAMIYS